jgi:hypothetical protein
MTDAAAAERPPVHPLIGEAMKKAALIWIGAPGSRPVAAWTVWHEGAAYVVHGGGEQPIPGLVDAASCDVLVRSGENHARIASYPAAASRVEPGSEEWATVVPLLLAKRLNLPDPAGAEDRWAADSVVTRLTPTGAPGPHPDGSLAEPPIDTPATTKTTVPFTIHKKPRP